VKNKQLLQILSLASGSGLNDDELESLVRGIQNDLHALNGYYSKSSDKSALKSEINRFRYLRSDCTLRVNSNASNYDSWRALATIAILGGTVSAFEIPNRLYKPLSKLGVKVVVESDEQWLNRVASTTGRVRIVGSVGQVSDNSPLANCEIAIYDQKPTESGYVELLPYFKEQAVTITAHRFGNPVRFLEKLAI
jgi:RHH-type proline utilization regulon transcriptional repressor/proline dehydrogenase/delta 1-pyrroline-5-carboxylate dehydrogenase